MEMRETGQVNDVLEADLLLKADMERDWGGGGPVHSTPSSRALNLPGSVLRVSQ